MSMSDVSWVRSGPSTTEWPRIMADLARGAIMFSAVAVLGFVVFVGLLRSAILDGIQILFYRGIALAILASLLVAACVALTAVRAPQWASIRDSIAAAALAFGLNISVLTVVPVTIDRSISIFLLGHMDENSSRSFTATELDQTFRKIYLTDLAQIERRMLEQKATGHVVQDGSGWRITEQGRGFVTTAKRLGALFDVDTRLLSPSTISAQRPPAPTGR
jgi:hypothetical protein